MASMAVSITTWLSQKRTWLGRFLKALSDQGLVAGSGFLINILLGRWLVPEQYGSYALAYSVFLFGAGFHQALLLEPMSVFGPTSYKDQLPAYLGTLLRLHFAITIALSLLLGLGVAGSQYFFKVPSLFPALAGVGVAAPCILFFWLWRRVAYLDLRPGIAVRGAVIYVGIVVVLLVLLVRTGWLSPLSAFLTQAVAGLAAGVMLVFLIPPGPSSSTKTSSGAILKQHWEYGRWAILSATVYWLSNGAYYVIVGTLLGIKEAAALRALQNFVLPIPHFVSALSLLFLPWASARFADSEGPVFRRGISNISLLFTAVATGYLLCLMLWGRWLIEVLYKGKYTPFAYLLPLMALPVLFTAVFQGPAIGVRAMQAPSEIFRSYAAAGAVTLVVGISFTYYWGLLGAVLGATISSLASLVVIAFRYRIRVRRAEFAESFGAK